MKNRVLRTALAVILVISMVLTMAACGGNDSDDKDVPTTQTPSQSPATDTPATDAPDKTDAPKEEIKGDAEKALAEYGFTFPTFDLVYDEDGDSNKFGMKIDLDNKYQDAYIFEIEMDVEAESFEGDKVSFVEQDNEDNNGTSAAVAYGEEYYVENATAGTYTVTYTVTVAHDEDFKYGFFTPGEVDEEFEVVKTYVVEKADLVLETKSDAFRVEDAIFFKTSSVEGANKLGEDYSASVNVTMTDGTTVGEFPLEITIFNEDDQEVAADEVVLANYKVSVKEGTRYILSKADIAKANAVRNLYSQANGGADKEYAVETITYYNTLTDAQKQMAAFENPASGNKAHLDYIQNGKVTLTGVGSIEELEKNFERADLVEQAEEAIKGFYTASTDTKKEAALKVLAELLLNIDNTPHEYRSDLLYVLETMNSEDFDGGSTADTTPQDRVAPFVAGNKQQITAGKDETKDDFDYNANTTGDKQNNILIAFQAVKTDDANTYKASFGYGEGEATTAVVNKEFDKYIDEFVKALAEEAEGKDLEAELAKVTIASDGTINQTEIDDVEKALEKVKEKYEELIVSFQPELKITTDVESTYLGNVGDTTNPATETLEDAYNAIVKDAEDMIARWDAYIELIDSYNLEDTYINNNKNISELGATYQAMYTLLGYNFANASLEAKSVDEVDGSHGGQTNSLSNALFEKTAGKFYVPEVFLEGAISAHKTMIDATIAVQEEVTDSKAALINYVIAAVGSNYELIANEAGESELGLTWELTSGGAKTLSYENLAKVLLGDYTGVTNVADYDTFIALMNNKESNGTALAENMALNENLAGSLDALYTYIDFTVAKELLEEGSSFNDNLAEDGLDAVMVELFEDLVGNDKAVVNKRIDTMADDINKAEVKVTAGDDAIVLTPTPASTVAGSYSYGLNGAAQDTKLPETALGTAENVDATNGTPVAIAGTFTYGAQTGATAYMSTLVVKFEGTVTPTDGT